MALSRMVESSSFRGHGDGVWYHRCVRASTAPDRGRGRDASYPTLPRTDPGVRFSRTGLHPASYSHCWVCTWMGRLTCWRGFRQVGLEPYRLVPTGEQQPISWAFAQSQGFRLTLARARRREALRPLTQPYNRKELPVHPVTCMCLPLWNLASFLTYPDWGTTPSCCMRPKVSQTARSSTTFPPAKRCIVVPITVICLPVGAMPRKSPVCVPRTV